MSPLKGPSRTVVAGATILVLGLGVGWLTLDALDLAPGVLTFAPVPDQPQPFPSAPGAVVPGAVTPVLDDLDPDAPMPDAATVTAWSRALVEDDRMGNSTTVVVSDVLTGDVLTDIGGDVAQVPASTTKILTAVAALTALGPDRTLDTTVVQPEPGRIVLVAGGDVMLSADAGDPEVVDGHAGLGDLVAQTTQSLRRAGITEVSVGVDDTVFSGPAINPSWESTYLSNGYVAPIAPIAIHMAKTDPSEEYPSRFPDPTMQAAETFAGLLSDEGFTVTNVRRAEAGEGAVEIARVSSAPVADVVRHMLHVSDNTVAEVLGRLVAVERDLPGSFQGATTAVLAQVAYEGVEVTGADLDDCSGLSAKSRIPGGVLVDAITLAASTDGAALLPMLADLPVGGWLGTLADRFTSGPAEGLVRAKTGSLPGVTSLAGTIQTVDGRLLAFAVMADDTQAVGQWGPRARIDRWVQDVAGCGCAAEPS